MNDKQRAEDFTLRITPIIVASATPHDDIIRLAEKLVQTIREDCARICDERAEAMHPDKRATHSPSVEAWSCAQAIRKGGI